MWKGCQKAISRRSANLHFGYTNSTPEMNVRLLGSMMGDANPRSGFASGRHAKVKIRYDFLGRQNPQ